MDNDGKRNKLSKMAKALNDPKPRPDLQFCRLCTGTEQLTSLFEAEKEHLAFIKTLGGVDIMKDKNKIPAMACANCHFKLADMFLFCQRVEIIDKLRVQKFRNKAEVIKTDPDQRIKPDPEIKIKTEPKKPTEGKISDDVEVISTKPDETILLDDSEDEDQDESVNGSFDDSFESVKDITTDISAIETVPKFSEEPKKQTTKFNCKSCDKVFDTKPALRIHSYTVHRKRLQKCSKCPETFTRYDALKEHEMSAHGESEIACPDCSKVFKTKSDLKLHIAAVHENKRFPCTECKETFSTQMNLQRHLKVSHKFL